MNSYLILYPAFLMILLTFFLYLKNRLDANKAYKSGDIKGKYFKTYEGKAPYYLEISRQTLKNQFELPVVFYFLIVLLYINETIMIYELILSWLFSISRCLHCYIRLTSNYVPYRAKIFTFGYFTLIILSIAVLINLTNPL
tara:strand:+ start:60 stop:482 length:423 start_codon:yes stop_codon:yes gene_type:complete